MISSKKAIKEVLLDISKILSSNCAEDWGGVFLSLYNEIDEEEETTKRKIASLYGGMGSFNDLILHKNNKPLFVENDDLDRLRTHLYELIEGLDR